MTLLKISKVLIIVLFLMVARQHVYGQKTEINFNAYGGISFFRGNGSASTSSMNFNPYTSPNIFTTNPYGKQSEFSYSLEMQMQRVTKANIIYGAGLGYEILTSSIALNSINENGFIFSTYAAEGNTTLKNNFVTINPFVGQRVSYRKINFDILTGLDIAFCLESKEKGSAIGINKPSYSSDNVIAKPTIDFRPRIQIKTQLKKAGILVGYSLGLTNYQTQNNLQAYTSYLRFGLSYQLK